MSGVAGGVDVPAATEPGTRPKRAGLVLAVANVALPSIGKELDALQTALNLVAVA